MSAARERQLCVSLARNEASNSQPITAAAAAATFITDTPRAWSQRVETSGGSLNSQPRADVSRASAKCTRELERLCFCFCFVFVLENLLTSGSLMRPKIECIQREASSKRARAPFERNTHTYTQTHMKLADRTRLTKCLGPLKTLDDDSQINININDTILMPISISISTLSSSSSSILMLMPISSSSSMPISTPIGWPVRAK